MASVDTPETATPHSVFWLLPAELLLRVINIIGNEKDYRTLAKIQRTSRDFYLVATPLMYLELGPNFHDILASLRPLLLIDPGGDHHLDTRTDNAGPETRHPIDQSRLDRLLWQYSKVERLVYEPIIITSRLDSRSRRSLDEHLDQLFDTLETQRPDFKPCTLLANARNVAINLAKLEMRRKMLESFEASGWESDNSFHRDDYVGEEWEHRHPPMGHFLKFIMRYSTPNRICLNLEGHPLYGGHSYFNDDLVKDLGRLGCEYVTIHQITKAGSILELPLVKHVILDIHPHYTTVFSRTMIIGPILVGLEGSRVTSDPPMLLVQKLDCSPDDESQFKEFMDKRTSIPEGQGTKAFKLEWKYLEREGKVDGCDLCHELFTKRAVIKEDLTSELGSIRPRRW